MSTIASVAGHGDLITVVAPNDETKPTLISDGVPLDATVGSGSNSEESSNSTMAEHFYRYKVQMTCGGCSGAVTRVLTKAKESGAGVNDFTVSLENQSVEVRGPIDFDNLTARIEKTGKKILEKEEVIDEGPAPAAQVETTAQALAVA
ncbi:ATX1 [Sanghuangporus weigelae]